MAKGNGFTRQQEWGMRLAERRWSRLEAHNSPLSPGAEPETHVWRCEGQVVPKCL
ncbi:hypothetical protein H634G_11511 [Metarhizium anisopliae BRIP 53293]|uniref:Uncharacterized protein n=1 Tax=Metarhizium anisopliae BRIP 53293 TaxID=1291518 RepID=A0A0D9NHC3_METAN|nr:hypothetical protein H634G_11511 [Metarhizium anisopliae BRIP 53293]KJK84710.1 hypothetical protein H633G_11544 [Metarhizium anisopliae BRIP 53284]